jgi:carboxypeptidase PM20D1
MQVATQEDQTMKQVFTAILTSAVLALAGLSTTYAQDSKTFSSLQMKGVALVNVPVDANAAAKRLSSGIKFPTISNQDRKDFDEQAFKNWREFLKTTYPLAHKTLKLEIIGSPRRYSLLYTWTGTNPALAPVILMAHQDVVPVVPGTEKQWEHGAFSGDRSAVQCF